jgi:hypothetical protein
MTDLQIWPDDARKASVTLAFAAADDLDNAVDSIVEAVKERPASYVLAVLEQLTSGLGDEFSNPRTVAAFQTTAAQWQAHEDDLRARGEWRNDE